MSRIGIGVLSLVIASVVIAGNLRAADAAASREVVWVGVVVMLPDEETNEYLIGTIDKKILDEIELGKYDRKFVRLSNLRIESEPESELEGARPGYLDCADQYDWGVILVRYEDILSIELKKHDPLEVY